MRVPRERMDEAVAVARATAEQVKVGDPADATAIGPVASRAPEWKQKAEALGPVADRVIGGPVFLNPMRNGIPGHCPTPADAVAHRG